MLPARTILGAGLGHSSPTRPLEIEAVVCSAFRESPMEIRADLDGSHYFGNFSMRESRFEVGPRNVLRRAERRVKPCRRGPADILPAMGLRGRKSRHSLMRVRWDAEEWRRERDDRSRPSRLSRHRRARRGGAVTEGSLAIGFEAFGRSNASRGTVHPRAIGESAGVALAVVEPQTPSLSLGPSRVPPRGFPSTRENRRSGRCRST